MNWELQYCSGNPRGPCFWGEEIRTNLSDRYLLVINVPLLFCRIQVMVISQSYFFRRAWRLSNCKLWPLFLFGFVISSEWVSGQANFFVTLYKRTEAETKPPETVDLLCVHLSLIAILDLAVTVGFVFKLRSLSLKRRDLAILNRGDMVIRQIFVQTIVFNIIFTTLALTTLLWVLGMFEVFSKNGLPFAFWLSLLFPVASSLS